MGKERFPSTPATRFLKENGVPFELHSYKYEEHGGTEKSSRDLGVDETFVVKTIVMEDDRHNPFIVLMHGNMQISAKEMARFMETKSVSLCDPEKAHKITGYLVGGTSPFGTRRKLPVYIEGSILELSRIYINAGSRGLLAAMSPRDLQRVLESVPVSVGR